MLQALTASIKINSAQFSPASITKKSPYYHLLKNMTWSSSFLSKSVDSNGGLNNQRLNQLVTSFTSLTSSTHHQRANQMRIQEERIVTSWPTRTSCYSIRTIRIYSINLNRKKTWPLNLDGFSKSHKGWPIRRKSLRFSISWDSRSKTINKIENLNL
jgi:hypothetical protein